VAGGHFPVPLPNAGEGLDLPIPIQPQHVVEGFVTPSPPSHTRLSPPLSPGQQSADLPLRVVAHLAKGPARVSDPEVVNPPGQRGIDLLHQFRRRSCAPPALRSRIFA